MPTLCQLSGMRGTRTAMPEYLLKLKWRQSSPDRKIGLEQEEEAAVNKNGKSRGREQSAERQAQAMLPLHGLARAALRDTVAVWGLAFVEEEMEAERAPLCGPRYAHLADRQALRPGHLPSSLVMGTAGERKLNDHGRVVSTGMN
jgi:hypothetical protein